MSEFFSGSKPDLISLKSINDLLALGGNKDDIVLPFKKSMDAKSFYYNYIKPNMLPIVLILLFFIALLIRYLMLKENPEINKKEKFNAGESVFVQKNHNNYVSGDTVIYDLEDNIDENELMDKIRKRTEVPLDKYVPDDKRRDLPVEGCDDNDREIIYRGRDDWLNQSDGFDNPFFGNNLVTSTASAVQFGLEQNNRSIDSVAKEMFG